MFGLPGAARMQLDRMRSRNHAARGGRGQERHLESIIAWIVMGLTAGWLAKDVMKGGRYGVVRTSSSRLGGHPHWRLLLNLITGGSAGFLGSVVVAFIGAVLIAVLRALPAAHRSLPTSRLDPRRCHSVSCSVAWSACRLRFRRHAVLTFCGVARRLASTAELIPARPIVKGECHEPDLDHRDRTRRARAARLLRARTLPQVVAGVGTQHAAELAGCSAPRAGTPYVLLADGRRRPRRVRAEARARARPNDRRTR